MLDTDSHNRKAAIGQARQVVKQLVKSDEISVLVTELACHQPGCSPVETVIALLDRSGSKTWKIGRPVVELTEDEITAALSEPPIINPTAQAQHGGCCGVSPGSHPRSSCDEPAPPSALRSGDNS